MAVRGRRWPKSGRHAPDSQEPKVITSDGNDLGSGGRLVTNGSGATYRLCRKVGPGEVVAMGSPGTDDPPAREEDVDVRAGSLRLAGHLSLPAPAIGMVVFAHGSGSSRRSPRNRYVAAVLNEAGLGTLLFDLLSADEELDRANVFDVELLASRLVEVTRWLRTQPEATGLEVGYFGASTGAAAALWAASEPHADVAAIVSRGGRPDLAAPRLGKVRAPTLLIVGGNDRTVLDLNRSAQAQLRCENRLSVVAGATHLFEEPGTLLLAAEAARGWFASHFVPPHQTPE